MNEWADDVITFAEDHLTASLASITQLLTTRSAFSHR